MVEDFHVEPRIVTTARLLDMTVKDVDEWAISACRIRHGVPARADQAPKISDVRPDRRPGRFYDNPP